MITLVLCYNKKILMHVIVVDMSIKRKNHLCYHTEHEAYEKAISIIKKRRMSRGESMKNVEDSIMYDVVSVSYQKKEVRE